MKIVLVDKNSALYKLPAEFSHKDLLLFDSIRFIVEIIEMNYNGLIDELEKATTYHGRTNSNHTKNLPLMFNYCWNIIDYSHKFIKLIKLQSPKEEKFFKEIAIVSKFRNTFQHIDERVDECLYQDETPFLGVITWLYKQGNTGVTYKYFARSGLSIPRNKQIEVKLPDEEPVLNTISNIKIETFIDQCKKSFSKEELNISNHLNAIKSIVVKLESGIKDIMSQAEINPQDWIKRRDIIVRANIID